MIGQKFTFSAILLTIFFMLASLSFAGAPNDDEVRALFNKAQELENHKEKGDAADTYKEIIDNYPDSTYAISSVQRLQYNYKSFGKKWLGVNYFNSIIKRGDVPESLRAQARSAIAYVKEMYIYSSTYGTFAPKQKVAVNVNGNNIDELDVNIYKLDRDYIISVAGELRNILNLEGVKRSLVQNFKKEIKKYKGNNYFNTTLEFTLQDPGIYICEANSEYLMTKTVVVVTNNILVIKSDQNNTLVWLTDRISGKPVENAQIIIPTGDRIEKGNTDSYGIFYTALDLQKYNSSIITAASGDDISVSDAYFYRAYEPVMVYIYTDRPIYRPAQKIDFKGVIRDINDEEYSLPLDSKVDIIIRDARYKEVKKFSADLSKFGTFIGDYDIPEEPPLGRYTIDVRYGNRNYYSYFTVQEYKKPEYFITISPEKKNYIVGDKIKVNTSTKYYFGENVPDADLQWEVYERRYYYPWWMDYQYSWYLSYKQESYYYGYGRGNFITRGEGKTDERGNAAFEFGAAQNNYDSTYTIIVKVTDKSRKVVESETTLMVTVGEFRVNIMSDKYSYKEDEDVFVKLATMDYNGAPVSQLLDIEIKRIRWKDGKSQPAELFFKKSVETSSAGKGEFNFRTDEVGQYDIVVTATDSRGTVIKQTRSIYVYNYSYGGSYYFSSGKGIEITPDKDMYQPGETANLFVTSQFPDSYALVTVEQKKLYFHKIVKLSGNSFAIPIELLESYKPSVTVSVNIVSNNNLLREFQTIVIIPEDKFMTIEIAPDKEKYKPGEPASFTVRTKDHKGAPVSAEVSFALVDESIFSLMSDQSLPIEQFFYGLQQNWVQTRTSFEFSFWGQTGGLAVPQSAPALEGVMEMKSPEFAADAVGGMRKSKALGAKNERSDFDDESLVTAEIRKDFKDTAFYRARVTTDDTGTAGIEVKLPDNLTTWRASVKGVTLDTKVGQASKTILVTKDLLVRLEMPRFFTKRDVGTVTGIVHNYLNTAKKVKVILDVAGINGNAPFVVDGKSERWVDVGANEEKRIDWKVDVERVGEAQVTLKALTDEESDAVMLKIPVLPHGIMRYTGSAGTVDGSRNVELNIPKDSLNESASVKLVFSPTVANVVTESLEYLIGYPYGCVEQTMSRFMPDILVSKTLQNLGIAIPKELNELPDMVAKGLERLYSFQHSDGGWGWWEQDETHPYMTAYVVYGLSEARNADYSINQDILNRGMHSLNQQIKESKDINTTAFMAYALARSGAIKMEILNRIYDDVDSLNNYSLAIFAESLYFAKDSKRAKKVIEKLIDNAQEASGQFYFNAKTYQNHGWYDSNVETTAYALKAIVRIDPKNEIVPKLVLWLANNRVGNRWYNTKSTAAAVMALSEYLMNSDEMAPDYSFEASVNGKSIGRFKVTKENMFTFDGVIQIDNSILKAGDNLIEMTKSGKGTLYYSAFLKYYTNEEGIGKSSAGITVDKKILKKSGTSWVEFDGTLKTGDEIKIMIDVSGGEGLEYVIIEDPKPAGCDEVIRSYESSASRHQIWWSNIDHRDEKVAVFITRMWQGGYHFEYELTAQTPGEFHVMPTSAYTMYKDEVGGNSDEFTIRIND